MKRDCIGLTPRRQRPAKGREENLLISPTLCPTFRTISRSPRRSRLSRSSSSNFFFVSYTALIARAWPSISPLFRYMRCSKNSPRHLSIILLHKFGFKKFNERLLIVACKFRIFNVNYLSYIN